jgi:hypothetical protein
MKMSEVAAELEASPFARELVTGRIIMCHDIPVVRVKAGGSQTFWAVYGPQGWEAPRPWSEARKTARAYTYARAQAYLEAVREAFDKGSYEEAERLAKEAGA